MMKEKYESVEMEIIIFQAKDVIMTSDGNDDPSDDYMMPIR